MEEQDAKDSLAWQQAMKNLDITQEFNYANHTEIYIYAGHAVEPPIETIDAIIVRTIGSLRAASDVAMYVHVIAGPDGTPEIE
jgi:hypothetical protein